MVPGIHTVGAAIPHATARQRGQRAAYDHNGLRVSRFSCSQKRYIAVGVSVGRSGQVRADFPKGQLGTKPPFAVHRYYLNCQAVPEIPAGRSVTFGMRVPVPAISGRARQAKYRWSLQGTTVATGGVVTVAPGTNP